VKQRMSDECNCEQQPATLAAGFKIGSFDPEATASAPFPDEGYGIMVGGLPLGDSQFVHSTLSRKVDSILKDNRKICNTLRSTSAVGLFAVYWHCCQPLLQHEMQNLPPRVMQEHLRRFDVSLLEMTAESTIDLRSMDDDDPVKRRARLPKRHNGLGMRNQCDLAYSAHVGCLLRTLPELATRTLSDGSEREGMFEDVADSVFGTGSFNFGNERNRFGGLFANESRLRDDFGDSWEHLQDESDADVDDPKEMLTAAPPEAIGCIFKEKPDEGASLAAELLLRKFSKKITEEVEDAKAEQLRTDMLALPVDSRVRQAYLLCDEFSMACLGCIPTARDNIRATEWRDIFCTLLGLPNPLFHTFIGKPLRKKDGNVRKKDVNGVSVTVKLTEHGDELGADLRQGEMTRKHDHIKNCFYSLMKWMGYPAIMEAKGLFRAYASGIENNPAVQNDTKLGEIIQPDFCIGTERQHLGEVKTISRGHYEKSGTRKSTRGAAVKAKAQTVFTDYRKKARNADHKYNGTAAGAVGPIEERLQQFGVVRAFVFGVYGETNEATRAEISEMAMVGAAKLWRGMGQTSQVKAYAVLKHSLTRSLGIAAVRANARMRLRVLSLLSKGGTSVPVGSAADENRHHEEAERENYRRNGPRGRATFAAHSNNCI